MATYTYFVNTPSGTIPTNPAPAYLTGLTTNHVSGTLITAVSLTFYGFNHTWTGDLDILLEYSEGANVSYLQVMSDVGGSDDLVNATIGLSDSASSTLPSTSTGQPVAGGTYRPFGTAEAESFENFFAGGGSGLVPTATGEGAVSFATQFSGRDASANWNLYVRDDTSIDDGSFQAWSLTLTTNTDIGLVRFSAPSTVISFSSSSATDGFYTTGNGNYVEYSGVTGWQILAANESSAATVFAGAGNDTISGSKFGTLIAFGGDGNDAISGGLRLQTH